MNRAHWHALGILKYGHHFGGSQAEVAQPGKARAWNLVADAGKLVALCASGVQISPSAPNILRRELLRISMVRLNWYTARYIL